MKQFKDTVAIATGGGSGIGQALCQELGQRGSIVVVADINDDQAAHVASAIKQNGGRAHAVHVDVSNEEEVRKLINGTVSEYGRLDYLFNNAGISIGGDARDLTLEQWRRVLEVNLYGVLYGTVIAYPIMVGQGSGHIVNVSSAAGLFPGPINAPYCTSKYGIVGLSLSLRVEGSDLGVNVSVVCPGAIRTNIWQAATAVNLAPEQRAAYEQQITSGKIKMMDASEAARTILGGVSHNQAIIIFPAGVRLAWRLYRLSPRLLDRLLLNSTRNFRKYRLNP
ncbi:MAG TPA: SDR family oxidoreductase [Candidatus Acidoferrales bacterium]|nr:SDR family oxidoreductase [Candidatus Acidoferrales bacterium]